MNQRIMKGIGMAAMLGVLVGCNEINFSGLLNITAPITFAGQNRNNVVINPGQFNAKASIGQSGQQKQIKLEINNTNPATKVQINFDKNINIGETFNLAAAQIGQNFDLAGTMKTTVTNSPEQSGSESCTYQTPQTVCRSVKSADTALTGDLSNLVVDPVATPDASNPVMVGMPGGPQFNGPMPPPPHTPTCNTVWVTAYGTMWTRYYIETTVRDLAANFVQGANTLGTYTGQSTETRRVDTYQSQCR